MNISKEEQTIHKTPVLESLQSDNVSALRKYQNFFVGSNSFGNLLKFEFASMIAAPMPGALGYVLRKWIYPQLLKQTGSGVNWGRNVNLRHPNNIMLGHRVAIDDNCLLDGKGHPDGLRIGDDVLISRNCIIQAKAGPVEIGDRTSIGSDCTLGSSGGIKLGKAVMIAGNSYIGGGRYRYGDRDTLIMDQGVYTKGPVVIEDDVWLGAGVIVQDGVKIGRGSVVGSGAVVREDLPEYTVVTPHFRLVMLPR